MGKSTYIKYNANVVFQCIDAEDSTKENSKF